MKNFWDSLNKPILALAPMYDVTDAAFRAMFAKYGKPDVTFTEFVSADGLASNGYERLKHHLIYSDAERPIVAQIFGATPSNFEIAAKKIQDLGFDGIDINMGCPDKAVVKQCAGAGMFRNPELAKEVVRATKSGAPNLPVSVKIRIGDNKIDWENWISNLLEVEPSAISIHLRTRKEMSKVPAHWEEMPKIVNFVNQNALSHRPFILGNGDIATLNEAKKMVDATGCDGVMIGRGAFGSPWFFSEKEFTFKDKMKIMLEHTRLFESTLGTIKPFAIMKKHFKAYITGFDGASIIREELYKTESAEQVEQILKSHGII